ncbi:hypothetical protein PNOK_0315800 [Pyrrhoderma noxium]|uniref:Uncharacterized protein n=1 Tax=Pyrrhoderma noxium TaxID=2282107 RepID=A0A286ULP5_9AGAM|nr:hypothetical protein PNOK_0315800 [Pyrrhoderma noxium]
MADQSTEEVRSEESKSFPPVIHDSRCDFRSLGPSSRTVKRCREWSAICAAHRVSRYRRACRTRKQRLY